MYAVMPEPKTGKDPPVFDRTTRKYSYWFQKRAVPAIRTTAARYVSVSILLPLRTYSSRRSSAQSVRNSRVSLERNQFQSESCANRRDCDLGVVRDPHRQQLGLPQQCL